MFTSVTGGDDHEVPTFQAPVTEVFLVLVSLILYVSPREKSQKSLSDAYFNLHFVTGNGVQ